MSKNKLRQNAQQVIIEPAEPTKKHNKSANTFNAQRFRSALTKDKLKEAFIWKEILDKPLGLR